MKKHYKVIIAALFLTFNFSFGQTMNVPNSIQINEGKELLDKKERSGFYVDLAGDEKSIIKSFENFLEDEKKYDVKSFFKKISAENILVPAFSDKHFNLNAEVRNSGSQNRLWYWISYGTDIYINSTDYPEEAQKCKDLLKEFSKAYYTDFLEKDMVAVEEELEDTRDELKSTEKTIASLAKDQLKEKKRREKLEKSKVKLQEQLVDLKVDIEDNETEIQKKEKEINELKNKLDETSKKKSSLEQKVSNQEKSRSEIKTKIEAVQRF